MKPSVWYHTADQQPKTSGYYLSYRGWGIGGKSDYDNDYGYVYYDQPSNSWRAYRSGDNAIVFYWTDAAPDKWVESDPPVIHRKKPVDHPALKDAWNNVKTAIEQYELIRILVTEQEK